MHEKAIRLPAGLKPRGQAKTRLYSEPSYSAKEFEVIKVGHFPLDQDDHWLAYFKDGWFYLHRSLSGFCEYQLKLEPDHQNRYQIVEAWVGVPPE
jgi:hypothetical protein